MFMAMKDEFQSAEEYEQYVDNVVGTLDYVDSVKVDAKAYRIKVSVVASTLTKSGSDDRFVNIRR